MPRLSDRQGGPSKSEVSARIKAERLRLGISAREVSRRLGMSLSSYQQIESVTTLPYRTLQALVRDVGMDARVLAEELFTST